MMRFYILLLLTISTVEAFATRFLNGSALSAAVFPILRSNLRLFPTSNSQDSGENWVFLEGKILSPSLSAKFNPVVEAAATVTQQSCALLGTKSIGVDYGLVRTGLAASNGYAPRPIEILSNDNATEVIWRVLECVKSEQAQQIVVGLPLHKNGTEAEQTNLTRTFASQLSCSTMARLGPSVKVYLWDERYTSKEAEARIRSEDPGRNLYNQLDADAACIILENFYEENGTGAEKVLIPEEMRETCRLAWEAQQNGQKQLQSQNRFEVTAGTKRRQAMERARRLEESMATEGTLGTSRKKKKLRKNRKTARPKGTWTPL